MKNPREDIHPTTQSGIEDRDWTDAGSSKPWRLRSVAKFAAGALAAAAAVGAVAFGAAYAFSAGWFGV